MAKETSEVHGSAALENIAKELESHAATLRAAAALLSVVPAIEQIEIRYENSRRVGLTNLRNWVSAAQQSAFDARLAASQNHVKAPSIRISKHPKKDGAK